MDTNRDGIIDDSLATKKKVGRKSLGLTSDEMKEHRKVLRLIREENKKRAGKRNLIEQLVWLIADRHAELVNESLATKSDPDDAEAWLIDRMQKLIDELTDDETLVVKRSKAAKSLAGYGGERLRRRR